MTNRTSVAVVPAALVAVGFVAAVAINWPGHLSFDSILQLLQGRMGLYNTWHPPVMAWLLGLGDAVVPGAGLFVVLQAMLGFGALAAVTFATPVRNRWLGAGIAVAIVLTPQMALYQGIVWKDVLFADAALAGFVCLAMAARDWARLPMRATWLAGAFGLLVLAALARQNGLLLLPFASVALAWIAARQGRTRVMAALTVFAALGALAAAVFAGGAVLALKSDGSNGPAEQFHVLQVYDLSGAVAREPGFPLDALTRGDPALARAIRGDGAKLYSPVRNDPITDSPQVSAAMEELDADALRANWRTLITQHSWLYLKIRAADFFEVFVTPDIVAARPVFTGIEGPAPQMQQLGLAPRRDARDLALADYAGAFENTPVFSHVLFALIAIAAVVLLLRRRRPADIALAALLGSALAFAASFFVISISCDYRYLYFLDLSAMATLLYLALDIESAVLGTP